MRGKRYAKTEADIEAENTLAQLFPDSDDGDDFDFDGIELPILGRWLRAICDLGGVATIYRKSGGDGVVFSARVGDHRKSFDLISADQFNALMPTIADQYHLAAHKLRVSRTKSPEPPELSDKQKSSTKPPARGKP